MRITSDSKALNRMRAKVYRMFYETPAQKVIREGLEILRKQDWRSFPPSWLKGQRVA